MMTLEWLRRRSPVFARTSRNTSAHRERSSRWRRSFGVENLPPTVKGDAEMLQDFPCSMAALSDEQLLNALGE